MHTSLLQTPVVLTIFNRPDNVRRVFEAIKKARPRQLFIIADGPRTDAERLLCNAARTVVENIDWQCEVHKDYLEKNIGAKMRLATGISRVFEQVDRAIILEHDCLPHPDFFTFCEELLERYKDDERVMHISGDNFQDKNPAFVCEESYYFSVVSHIWGFATWRRAWAHYDVSVSLWPEARKNGWLANIFDDPAVRDRWEYRFQQYYEGAANSWDGQWSFACFINNGLCVNPRKNLVSNIGFGPGALTTTNMDSEFANMSTYPMPTPFTHPKAILPNRAADAYIFKYFFNINRYPKDRVIWFLKSRFPHLYLALKKMWHLPKVSNTDNTYRAAAPK